MLKDKRIIGLVLLLLVGVVVLGIASRSSSKSPSASQPSQSVTISNIATYSDRLQSKNLASNLESALQNKFTEDKVNTDNAYTGNVRDNSYRKTINSDGIPYYKFLIDIPSLQRTYVVTLLGGDNYQQSILHITCPADNELVYPTQPCTRAEQ